MRARIGGGGVVVTIRSAHGVVLLAALFILVPAHALLLPSSARGHVAADPADAVLKDIGVDEKLGAALPPDLVFNDQDGKPVRLGDLFAGKPAILTLNYYTCPMLCPVTLRNLLTALEGIRGLRPERDYRVVTVSIDPSERPEAARARAGEIHGMMRGVPDRREAWRFLIGQPAEVGALTRAVGFRYKKVGAGFAHPDVNVVVTPDGKISRYLYGVAQDPADLKLALIEAAGGRIGQSTAINRILLYCYRYDPVGKRYALYAKNIMKAGGALTLVFLGVLYLLLWRRKNAPAGPGVSGKG